MNEFLFMFIATIIFSISISMLVQELCKKFITPLVVTTILNIICGYFLGLYVFDFLEKIRP